MKDAIEAVLAIVQTHTGYAVPASLIPYMIVSSMCLPFLLYAYLRVRRWLGDVRAIPGELQAAADLISGDTSVRLQQATSQLEAVLSRKLDAIQASLELKHEVTEVPSDAEIEAEPTAAPRGFRIRTAQAVRNTVMEKWLEGRYFKRSESDPNCYSFVGQNEAGNQFKIRLLTPYRTAIGDDHRLPFALDVWVDEYKKLNFEWDAEGNYSLRGFKKGEWSDDLREWHIKAITPARMAA